jgi:peptide chain release factor 2
MAADKFWNNRDQAQRLIEEANSLRGKIDPLLQAEKKQDDLRVMVELGEAEPEPAQPRVQQEIEDDLARFFQELDALELKVFLSGPHGRHRIL